MVEKLNYSESLKRLEEIIREIDSGEMELDQLAAKIKEANQLIAKCQKKLTQTEEEVKKILQNK
jgi:exodeoxyribonuclease VII small subunit